MKHWQLAALAVGVLALMKSSAPRGIRNNNPGNIRAVDGVTWQGQIGADNAGFIVFDTAENGLRALARVLRTYRDKHGLQTVAGIINRWAPTNENNTESYIQAVSQSLGVGVNQPLSLGQYPALVAAIIHHENGQQPYSAELIQLGVTRGFA